MQELGDAKERLKSIFRIKDPEDISKLNAAFNGIPDDSTEYNSALRGYLVDRAPEGQKSGYQNMKNPAAMLGPERSGAAALTSDMGAYKRMVERNEASQAGKFTFGKSQAYGYGMGKEGSLKANRLVHMGNIGKHLNPLGGSAREAMLNSVGFLSRAQRIDMKATGTVMGKLEGAVIPLGVGYMSVRAMMSGDDASDIFASNAAIGVGTIGWRAGKALGGVLSSTSGAAAGSGIGRLAAMGGFGALGFVAGMGIATEGYAAAKDLSSNESGIASAARDIYRRESMVNTPETRATLTSRQRNFQKLSNSGLNDRSQLLGNESLVLKNLM